MAVLLRDNVYRAIRRAILTCEFEPGQELREQILAERYRVSRSPIRDSLLRLEQENLVTVLPRQGYRVNPISYRDVEELFGLRLIISPACAAEAARADDAAVAALDRFRDASAVARDETAFLEYNRDFHGAVMELAGNARMAAVESALVEEFDRLVRISFQTYRGSWTLQIIGEHDAIIDAIQAHDSVTAHRLTYEHIAGGQRRIRAALQLNETRQDEASHARNDTR
jgi:DNA-binding GntR family transcriptional regulator